MRNWGKHQGYLFTASVLIFALFGACQRTPSAPLTVETLMNAEYHSSLNPEETIKLKDGEYIDWIEEGEILNLSVEVYPGMYAFGDLDGDSIEDAAVVLITSGGGSGLFISLEAVVNDNGLPNHIASASLGDRVVINSVEIDSGEIIVDLIAHGPEDALCCPSVETVDTFRLDGDALLQTGHED